MYGLDLKPQTAEEKAEEERPLPPNRGDMIENFRALAQDNLHKEVLQFVDLKTILDRTNDREKMISKTAAKQRAAMINNLKLTLVCAIASTVVISLLIAFFLMRSISSRLQHIMKNTKKLAKREALAQAIAG